MLNLTKSRFNETASYDLYNLSGPIEEGMVLCGTFAQDDLFRAFVQTSVAATDVPLGIAYSYFTTPSTAVFVDNFTVPGSSGNYAVALTYIALNVTSSGMLVMDTAGNTYTYNASPTGYQYSYNAATGVVTFPSTAAGANVFFTYRYNLTVAQAEYLVGDGIAGPTRPSDITATIGIVRRGLVYTSFFNPGYNYATPGTKLYINNNGIIDPTATSNPILGGYVRDLPTSDTPFLGIQVEA